MVEVLLVILLFVVLCGTGLYIYHTHYDAKKLSKQSSGSQAVSRPFVYQPVFISLSDNSVWGKHIILSDTLGFLAPLNWKYVSDNSWATQPPHIFHTSAALFAPNTTLKNLYTGVTVTNPTLADNGEPGGEAALSGAIIYITVAKGTNDPQGKPEQRTITSLNNCPSGATTLAFSTFVACRETLDIGQAYSWDTATSATDYTATLTMPENATSQQKDYDISLAQALVSSFGFLN